MSDSINVPCALGCAIATSALLIVARTSFVMGSSSDARGSQSYQSAFWGGSLGLASIILAFGIIKLVDEK